MWGMPVEYFLVTLNLSLVGKIKFQKLIRKFKKKLTEKGLRHYMKFGQAYHQYKMYSRGEYERVLQTQQLTHEVGENWTQEEAQEERPTIVFLSCLSL